MTKKEYKQIVKEHIKRISKALQEMADAGSKFDYDNGCIKVLDRLNTLTELVEEYRDSWREK